MNTNLDELKKKKVAIICPTLSRGGAERIVGLLSEQIEGSVDELFIFLFNSKEVTYKYKGKLVDLEFDNSSEPSKYRIVYLFNRVVVYFKLLLKLRSEKRKNGIDVSISFMDTPNILNVLSRTKDKVLLSVRINKSVQSTKHKISVSRRIEIRLMKILYRYSDKIIAISNGVRQDLISNFNLKEELVTTIYNFVDIKDIVNKKCEYLPEQYNDFFKNHDVIINVGRFEYQKNQLNLIDEFKLINKEFPNTRLVLVGKGTLESRIMTKVNKLGLANKVLIVPYTSNPFMYMNKAKIFVLNSYYEGFGNVLLEAMACNVPIISTDCKSGPREIITGDFNYNNGTNEIEIFERGILIPVRDDINEEKHYLQRAVEILMSDPVLRKNIVDSATDYVQNGYSNQEIKKQWLNEIEL